MAGIPPGAQLPVDKPFGIPMTRKNPENKPLRVVREEVMINTYLGDTLIRQETCPSVSDEKLGPILVQLAIAESNLVRAGKDSALPHFIAIVKELERIYGFKFEQVPQSEEDSD